MPLEVVIIPGEAIGPFRLGMTRSEIWAQDRSPIHAFFKTPFTQERTDDIRKFGLHVYYDERGGCDYMEAWTKTEHFHTILLLGDHVISGRSMREIREILAKSSISFTEGDFGFKSAEYGIGFYCHNFGSDECLVDGVSVMRKNG